MSILRKYILPFCICALLGSCAKEEIREVDFSNYNDDDPQTNTELDKWLTSTFIDEYNMDVVYRYNRYYHDIERNVTPPRLDAIRPTMESVLNGYLLPYRKVAGPDFIKKMNPKEWILFGSNSYASDGSVYAGTASAGRRINLYGINNYSAYGALHVIHHEFVHILNQLVNIPTDFETISKADYKATWASTPGDTARKYGFVNPYASGSYTEDYAETSAVLLVKGQAFFDNYANTSSALGKSKLKQKEANIANYFTANLKVDFRELQKEIQNYLKSTVYPGDLKFPQYLQRLFKTVTININDPIYTKYGQPSGLVTAVNGLTTQVAAIGGAGRKVNFFTVRFDTNNTATIRVNYTNSAGSAFDADFNFSYTYSTSTGEITFTKVAQLGTTGTYANAATIAPAFNNTLLPYFTGKTFTADWLKADVSGADYNRLAGFYEKGNTTNYWYGVLGQTL